MKFALFTEIPVAKPWAKDSEYKAYKEQVEQAVLAEQAGFHSFWSVEHHFLDEFSHCSNPEILYAHVAAKTSKLRIGYGVRLMPKPYNHPIRTAESVAVQDLLSDGRVEFGTGRS
ncbi:MAG: LLM class flavin-dependent oxidoreductase, partial [Myxococcales bacterium]